MAESRTSSHTPSGARISFRPLVIRTAVRGASGRVRTVKIRLRVGRAGDETWERDVLGAVNIGLRYLQMGGLCGVGPDVGPCGAGDAGEPAPRPNPAGGNIYNYWQMPLGGKRYGLRGDPPDA